MVWSVVYSRTEQDLFVSVSQVGIVGNIKCISISVSSKLPCPRFTSNSQPCSDTLLPTPTVVFQQNTQTQLSEKFTPFRQGSVQKARPVGCDKFALLVLLRTQQM